MILRKGRYARCLRPPPAALPATHMRPIATRWRRCVAQPGGGEWRHFGNTGAGQKADTLSLPRMRSASNVIRGDLRPRSPALSGAPNGELCACADLVHAGASYGTHAERAGIASLSGAPKCEQKERRGMNSPTLFTRHMMTARTTRTCPSMHTPAALLSRRSAAHYGAMRQPRTYMKRLVGRKRGKTRKTSRVNCPVVFP